MLTNDAGLILSAARQPLVYQTSGYDRELAAALRQVPSVEVTNVAESRFLCVDTLLRPSVERTA